MGDWSAHIFGSLFSLMGGGGGGVLEVKKSISLQPDIFQGLIFFRIRAVPGVVPGVVVGVSLVVLCKLLPSHRDGVGLCRRNKRLHGNYRPGSVVARIAVRVKIICCCCCCAHHVLSGRKEKYFHIYGEMWGRGYIYMSLVGWLVGILYFLCGILACFFFFCGACVFPFLFLLPRFFFGFFLAVRYGLVVSFERTARRDMKERVHSTTPCDANKYERKRKTRWGSLVCDPHPPSLAPPLSPPPS